MTVPDRHAVLIWSSAFGLTLLVAWATEIGPVIVPMTEGHGIHAGDLAAAVAAAAIAWRLTRATPGPEQQAG